VLASRDGYHKYRTPGQSSKTWLKLEVEVTEVGVTSMWGNQKPPLFLRTQRKIDIYATTPRVLLATGPFYVHFNASLLSIHQTQNTPHINFPLRKGNPAAIAIASAAKNPAATTISSTDGDVVLIVHGFGIHRGERVFLYCQLRQW
jgi:hypothetical protein